jgi:hypothetical protein
MSIVDTSQIVRLESLTYGRVRLKSLTHGRVRLESLTYGIKDNDIDRCNGGRTGPWRAA